MVRVLITDDSPVVAEILRKIFSSDPEVAVVGWARNGSQAVEMTGRLRPDVVTMDIMMPVMDGLEATKVIMREFPTSVIVISSSVNKEDLKLSFDIINAGALDVMEKPRAESAQFYDGIGEELIRRVKIVSRVRPFRRISTNSPVKEKPIMTPMPMKDIGKIVVIGASTGGPQAIMSILKGLPENLPVPMVAVQHISPGFIGGFVDWLNRECAVRAVVAKDGENPKPGYIYFPSDDCHLGLGQNGSLRLGRSLPVNGHRPSIDHLMRTAAFSYGANAIGVLLTGMGCDGVEGMKAIKQAGGKTLAQDEASSVIFGMPKEAIAAGAVDKVAGIDDLSAEIIHLLFRD